MAISEETKTTVAPTVNEEPKEQQPAKEQKTEEAPETKVVDGDSKELEATPATEEKKEQLEDKTAVEAPKIDDGAAPPAATKGT